MSHSIVFIEHIDEIDLLEDSLSSNTLIISMLPSVSSELKRRGIIFETTLQFFGVEGHRQTIKKSFEIVEELRPFLEVIKVDDVQHAFEKTWVFHFRFYLNYWFAMISIIDKVVKTYKPSSLMAFRTSFANKLDEVSSEKSYSLSSIIEEYAFCNNIKVLYVENNNNLTLQNYNRTYVKNWLKYFIFELQLRLFPFFRGDKASVVALEDTYNMPLFLREMSQNNDKSFTVYLSIQQKSLKIRLKEILKGKGYFFISISKPSKLYKSSNFHEYLKICTSQIKIWLQNHPEITNLHDVSPVKYLIYQIENTLNQKMVDLNSEISTLKRLLNYIKPDKVFAQHSLGISYALGEICLQNDIPALLISHGSHTPHKESLAELEWSIHAHTMINSHYPFVAIQSPYSKKFLNSQDRVISKEIETGPLLLSKKQKHGTERQKLRKKIFAKHHDKRIILHASSFKSWQSFRPWVFETVDEYIRNINDVIKALESIPEVFLAIRFRPQKGISVEDLKSSLIKSNKYAIYEYGEFIDFLLASDLLLSYSSTTIEEALQNQIPVLQYDPDGKYEHIPAHELTANGKNNISAVYSVMSKKNLIPGLLWWSEIHTKEKNQMISWPDYALDFDSKMEWISQME